MKPAVSAADCAGFAYGHARAKASEPSPFGSLYECSDDEVRRELGPQASWVEIGAFKRAAREGYAGARELINRWVAEGVWPSIGS